MRQSLPSGFEPTIKAVRTIENNRFNKVFSFAFSPKKVAANIMVHCRPNFIIVSVNSRQRFLFSREFSFYEVL